MRRKDFVGHEAKRLVQAKPAREGLQPRAGITLFETCHYRAISGRFRGLFSPMCNVSIPDSQGYSFNGNRKRGLRLCKQEAAMTATVTPDAAAGAPAVEKAPSSK